MRYQLVLQFLADSMADFDRLVALETKLIEELEEISVVDGHDFGSGKFNIFILTNEPATTFAQAHQIIVNEGIPNDLRSAYCETNSEDYVVVWPSPLWNSAFCRMRAVGLLMININGQLPRAQE